MTLAHSKEQKQESRQRLSLVAFGSGTVAKHSWASAAEVQQPKIKMPDK